MMSIGKNVCIISRDSTCVTCTVQLALFARRVQPFEIEKLHSRNFICDVGISLLIDSKCNNWAFQRTSASLRMDLLHNAKKLVNVVDGGLSARCAALVSVT